MENVAAIDTPDDDGGRITVSWDVNPAEDCTFYAAFIRLRIWADADARDDHPIRSRLQNSGYHAGQNH